MIMIIGQCHHIKPIGSQVRKSTFVIQISTEMKTKIQSLVLFTTIELFTNEKTRQFLILHLRNDKL